MATRFETLLRSRRAAAGLLALLAIPALIVLLRTDGPDRLAYRAVRAIERRDAAALCALGSPEERRRAGMTPRSVEAFLAQTLYREGDPGPLTIKSVNRMRSNYVQYLIATGRKTAGGKPRMLLLTTQQEKGQPFRIALGELLWNTIAVAYPRTNPDIAEAVYARLSAETGIRGWYNVSSGWVEPRAPGQGADVSRFRM